MSQAAIREYDGKKLLAHYLQEIEAVSDTEDKFDESLIYIAVQVKPTTNLKTLESPWDENQKLVVKPDQLIKRRGKLGLIKINATFEECLKWIEEKREQEISIGRTHGKLDTFLIEPFIPHSQEQEFYLCINSKREGDEILFNHVGGVEIEVETSKTMLVKLGTQPDVVEVQELLSEVKDKETRRKVAKFIYHLYTAYSNLFFAYCEINPLVILKDPSLVKQFGSVLMLDLAAKLDETASFQCHKYWGHMEFPSPFGHTETTEESYIHNLDERTGASLKLTVLNPKGRIWTMVAGGGASVIYADTISDFAGTSELGNYGEYSGAPTESMTYHYADTIIKLLLKHPHEEGKVLIIGGGIANFTNVADTFKGICRAIRQHQEALRNVNTKIYVRRGGPNFEKGLECMRECLKECRIEGSVHGPEDHITDIVARALNMKTVEEMQSLSIDIGGRFDHLKNQRSQRIQDAEGSFTRETFCIVYGMQMRAVQGMLDFDYISKRKRPSVSAIVYTFASGIFYRQFWFGGEEILISVYPSMKQALEKHKNVDTVVNFASSRSVYNSTMEMINFRVIRKIAIIAEGVPERETRMLINESQKQGVLIIGPATVGGVFPGRFKIGNTGGMLSNQIASKLYRPGSVSYVSRSGGLSNELNNIISKVTDGVRSGVAIGGDRYPITTFIDHILKFEADPHTKILVLLGEVGGSLEYEVIQAIKDGRITKPVVAWCTGTVAANFTYDVQFGHAGALAGSKVETAHAKNEALRNVGCFVPNSFQEFGHVLEGVYKAMITRKLITPVPEVEPPKVPVDYKWAQKIGMVRKTSTFMSSISDERGEELMYGGVPISGVLTQGLGIGGTIGLLWFRRKLPDYFCRFIETVLVITADHGPAVSGAHNTIVTARAGKDLVSSLTSGLLTIGPRFGGALDKAAKDFFEAWKNGLTAVEFVASKRKKKELIMGIGHKIKSLENPDKRVEIVVNYAKKHFKSTRILDYGLEVQAITTRKKSNLILNVDGAIACCFLDLMLSCGCFSEEEAENNVENGVLNGLFVLGRSIGFIGHFLDQKRLNQGLYRHPTDDIAYIYGNESAL